VMLDAVIGEVFVPFLKWDACNFTDSKLVVGIVNCTRSLMGSPGVILFVRNPLTNIIYYSTHIVDVAVLTPKL
jgi:hypothetical protein